MDSITIPCQACGWKVPIFDYVKEAGKMRFKVRCLRCEWEGYVWWPVQVETIKKGKEM
jgi:hypothetical protein